METNAQLILKMIDHEQGSPRRVQHFLKVLAFAELICLLENVDEKTSTITKIAAIVHDIGIRTSLAKYGSAAGHYQELEGPPLAQGLLTALSYDQDIISRVCYLVGHHHTYDQIDGLDYQILIEADFLVNAYEGQKDRRTLDQFRTIFRTESGKAIFHKLYGLFASEQDGNGAKPSNVGKNN